MPILRRPRLRDRRQTVTLAVGDECCRVWLPPAEAPLVLDRFGEAVALSFALLDAPIEREALVLLSAEQQLVAIAFDPCAVIGLAPRILASDGLVEDFVRTMLIVPKLTISLEPTMEEIEDFDALRRRHMLQGVELIDMFVVDTDATRSMAMALSDRDCFWHDHPEPGEMAAA
jgi:hypothetical protein